MFNFTHSSFNITEFWPLTQARWFFATWVHHHLSLLTFQIKLLFLVPKTCLLILLASCVMSSTILDLITGIFESFLNKIWCHCDGWMDGWKNGWWMEQGWIIPFISCARFVHQPIITKIWYQVTYKNPAATAHTTNHGAGEASSFPESSTSADAAVLEDSARHLVPRGLWVFSFC